MPKNVLSKSAPDLYTSEGMTYPLTGAVRVVAGAVVAILMIGGLTGCETPQQRQDQHAEMLSGLPAETQDKIKAGVVEPGFTEDMVYVALGKPDRTYTRRTHAGISEVWSYVDVERRTKRQKVSSRPLAMENRSHRASQAATVWAEVEEGREFEKLRIEFDGDVVRAVEIVNPSSQLSRERKDLGNRPPVAEDHQEPVHTEGDAPARW